MAVKAAEDGLNDLGADRAFAPHALKVVSHEVGGAEGNDGDVRQGLWIGDDLKQPIDHAAERAIAAYDDHCWGGGKQIRGQRAGVLGVDRSADVRGRS